MKPKRMLFIRHGESESNADPSLHANKQDYAMNLTENGKRQAIEAGKRLKNEFKIPELFGVYLSPYYRTRQTAELALESFYKYQVQFKYEDSRLREQQWGNYRELDKNNEIDEERQKYGSYFYVIPGGESVAQVVDRHSSFLETIHRDFEKENYPDTVLFFLHGMSIRAFLTRWFHWTPEEFETLRNPHNCEIFEIVRNVHNRYELTEPFPTKKNQDD